MEEQYVALADLAQRLHMDRSHARRYANRKGVSWLRLRTPESRQQITLALSAEEADRLVGIRAGEGFAVGAPVPGAIARPTSEDRGVFYLVQLVPELTPNRIKLGFASDIGARLAAHRTAAPTATVHTTWPCKRSWELAAREAITAEGCTWVGPEVFDCRDLLAIAARAHAFFSLMPAF